MKTFKKLVLVVFMFGTLFNYANEKKDFNTIVNAKKVKIEFTNVKKGNYVFVKDSFGTTLYSEEIKTNGEYLKFFDFSSLRTGNYTLELEKNTEIIESSFSKEGKAIVFKDNLTKTINKPAIYTKNNSIYISKLNFDNKGLEVEVFYNDEKVYTETLKSNSKSLNRVYKLLNDKKGEYTIVAKNNGRNFIKRFKF